MVVPNPRYLRPMLTIQCARCKALYDAQRRDIKKRNTGSICPFCGNMYNDFHNVIRPWRYCIIKFWRKLFMKDFKHMKRS